MGEIEKNPCPGWFEYEDKVVGQILKGRLLPTQKSISDSVAAVAAFMKNLKLMIESSEASAKFIKDLKKNEGKKFVKEQEAIDSKAFKVVEIGKKVSVTETEIDNLNREQKNLKKRKLNFSALKNMDKKAIAEKIANLNKEKDKQGEEFQKSRNELAQQLKVFNELKDIILRTFNAQSASIDGRMKDNIAFFRKKFSEMLDKLSFLKSDSAKTQEAASPSETSTTKSPNSPRSSSGTSLSSLPSTSPAPEPLILDPSSSPVQPAHAASASTGPLISNLPPPPPAPKLLTISTQATLPPPPPQLAQQPQSHQPTPSVSSTKSFVPPARSVDHI
jgi:hypothetical protein